MHDEHATACAAGAGPVLQMQPQAVAGVQAVGQGRHRRSVVSSTASFQPPPSTLYSVTRFCCCAACTTHHGLLRREQRALRIEHVQVAGHAVAEAQVGQAQALAPRPAPAPAARAAARPAWRGRPAHRPPRGRRAWIERSYCATAMSRLAWLSSRLAWLAPASKIGSVMRGANCQARLLEQPAQVVAGQADAAGQRDAREEGRARRADVGVGRLQLALGLAHVGPARQQLRRQPGRQLGQQALRLPAAGPAAGRAAAAGRPAAPARSASCARWRVSSASAARAPSTSDTACARS